VTYGSGQGGRPEIAAPPNVTPALLRSRRISAAPIALVLGFGNVLLSDDGAGVQLIERLRSELGADAADFVDAGTLSFSLLPYIEATGFDAGGRCRRYQRRAGNHRPVRRRGNGRFLSSARRRTVHEVGLIDLLDMARLQGLSAASARAVVHSARPHRLERDALGAGCEGLPEAARQARHCCSGGKSHESPHRNPDPHRAPTGAVRFGTRQHRCRRRGWAAASRPFSPNSLVLLERLAESQIPAAIDLRSLPMSPQDRIELQRALGEGEVQATVTADGLSTIRETRISGVWWVEHRDPEAN
jgi:hydrogenase maturation protease